MYHIREKQCIVIAPFNMQIKIKILLINLLSEKNTMQFIRWLRDSSDNLDGVEEEQQREKRIKWDERASARQQADIEASV